MALMKVLEKSRGRIPNGVLNGNGSSLLGLSLGLGRWWCLVDGWGTGIFFFGGVFCASVLRVLSVKPSNKQPQVKFKVERAEADGHSHMAFLTPKREKTPNRIREQ